MVDSRYEPVISKPKSEGVTNMPPHRHIYLLKNIQLSSIKTLHAKLLRKKGPKFPVQHQKLNSDILYHLIWRQ